MTHDEKRSYREELVKKDLIKMGFKVSITQGVYIKGTPDFVCDRKGEQIFVECKYGHDVLGYNQKEVVLLMIKAGKEIWVAKLDSSYKINYHKLKTIEDYNKFVYPRLYGEEKKCQKCEFEWMPRVATPLQCPKCKRYDWKEKKK